MLGRRPKRAVTFGIAAAILLLTGCSSATGEQGGGSPTLNPDEEINLSFSFWGNDVRAEMYEQAIDEFEAAHPNISVSVMFLAPTEYWEKRQVEAASGGLPDVITMDLGYLRQYTQNNSILDLTPYLGGIIKTDAIQPAVIDAASIDDLTTGFPISTNAWGMYQNDTLAEQIGAETFAGGSWDDFYDWTIDTRDAASAAGADVWGAVDPSSELTNFQLWLRAQGAELFDEEGNPGFDEADLAEFWNLAAPARESAGLAPQQAIEEARPLTAFDTALTVADLIYDNSGSGFVGNLGDGYTLSLAAPPLDEEGAKDLYLKVSQMYSISSKSDHPEAAATLIDFLVNSPESGEIFGTNRGVPASATARDAASFDGIAATIVDYEASIADRLGDAPPVPIVGYGSLEAKFRELVPEINFGTLTVDEAVDQFFTEMNVILNQ